MKRFPSILHSTGAPAARLLELGQPDTAELCFRKALELDPQDALAFEGLAQSKTFESGDPDLARMEEVRINWPEGTPADKRGILSYALAKAYDDIGEFEAAGRRVAEGAAFYREQAPFSTRPARTRHAPAIEHLRFPFRPRQQ
jgi:tetratricopeptide (TPR) repeat protein